jgi:hypothetical protein
MTAGLSDKIKGLKAACADGNLILCFGYRSVDRGTIVENNVFSK